MRRWMSGICALALVAALNVAGALAAVSPFSVSLQADGATLGAVSGALETAAAGDAVAWKIADAAFVPANAPGMSVAWNEASLAAAGTGRADEKATLKEFEVTVRQSSGVDVSYRFRLTATLSAEKPAAVSLEQIP